MKSGTPPRKPAGPLADRVPDLTAHAAGNTGIPYAWSFEAAAAGPHVLVTAVVHGNELCGAIVLDEVLRAGLRPKRGRLTLAFCNVEAFARFDRSLPFASRYVDEDMNRVWSAGVLDGGRDSVEVRRARALRPLVDAAELLLDIHSMQTPTEPLLLAGTTPRGVALARAVSFPASVVIDAGHAAGTRMRDYGAFGAPGGTKSALLVECGQHWDLSSLDVARETFARFLLNAGTIDEAPVPLPSAPPAAQRVIEVTQAVTIEHEGFSFLGNWQGLETLQKGTPIARDGGRLIEAPYDGCVLIMPSRRLKPGQTAVRLGRVIA